MRRMKSREARDDWSEVLRYVEGGGTVVVEVYNRPVARVIPADERVVVLRARDAVQAQRLRQLIEEHGAVGVPIPNNTTGWRVVDERGEAVSPHAITSVGVQEIAAAPATHILTIVDGEQPSVNGVEFGQAGVDVADEVYEWFVEHGVDDEVEPDRWVLVTPANEHPGAYNIVASRYVAATPTQGA